MLLLLTSIVCSVAVSVLLKLSQPGRIQAEQAIAVNYVMAAILCLVFLKPDPVAFFSTAAPWWLLALLGVTLPTIFLIMAAAVRHAGIVLSDAAQRLSLLLPLVAAFVIFSEEFSTFRLAGIAIAFIALLCLLARKPTLQTGHGSHQKIAGNGAMKTTIAPRYAHSQTGALLLGVWLGYGLIDIMFKQLARSTPDFSSSLLISFVLAAIVLGSYRLIRRRGWDTRSTVAGLLLGALNFGNIYFYIRAHQTHPDHPTLIFTTMNIGVITLGTLIGAGVFKERLAPLNIAGLILAVAAIILLVIK